MYTFYKGVLCSDLKSGYVPGTVTRNISEAVMWQVRISSKKRHGASRHIRHGESCLIKIMISKELIKHHSHFQVSGIHEHNRECCWTSAASDKAQINIPVNYEVVA